MSSSARLLRTPWRRLTLKIEEMGMNAENDYRIEHDTMGEVRVPINALYRAQTQRAIENFPISGLGLEPAHLACGRGPGIDGTSTDDLLSRSCGWRGRSALSPPRPLESCRVFWWFCG